MLLLVLIAVVMGVALGATHLQAPPRQPTATLPESTRVPVMATQPSPAQSRRAVQATVMQGATPPRAMSPTREPTHMPTRPPVERPTQTPLPMPSATPLPTRDVPSPTPCRYAVDSVLRSDPSAKLGCPTGDASTVWAAYQPFERGAMLWRSDINQVTIFYGDGTHETLPDQWEDRPYNQPVAPAGKVAPKRGFGWLWVTKPELQKRLGWGLVEEKGFCARLQHFEDGFAMRSTKGSCGNEFNRANEGDFKAVHLVASNSGSWVAGP